VVWAPPGGLQREEEPKQMHRWSHNHIHLIEVDEDRHQHERVRRQVMKLKVVVLQQHEEEGGRREREPGQDVGGEEHDFVALLVGERNSYTPYPPVVLHRLPSKQSPHPQEVIIRPEAGSGEDGHNCRTRWLGSRRWWRARVRRKKTESLSVRKQMRR
jgi:hypothetical protein